MQSAALLQAAFAGLHCAPRVAHQLVVALVGLWQKHGRLLCERTWHALWRCVGPDGRCSLSASKRTARTRTRQVVELSPVPMPALPPAGAKPPLCVCVCVGLTQQRPSAAALGRTSAMGPAGLTGAPPLNVRDQALRVLACVFGCGCGRLVAPWCLVHSAVYRKTGSSSHHMMGAFAWCCVLQFVSAWPVWGGSLLCLCGWGLKGGKVWWSAFIVHYASSFHVSVQLAA